MSMKCKLCGFDTQHPDILKSIKRMKMSEKGYLRSHYGYHILSKEVTGKQVDEYMKEYES